MPRETLQRGADVLQQQHLQGLQPKRLPQAQVPFRPRLQAAASIANQERDGLRRLEGQRLDAFIRKSLLTYLCLPRFDL